MRALVFLAALTSAVGAPAPQAKPAQSAEGFRIVVIAGEDAVNVIQQKSAVAPIVEVRDRNDQPVAGAVVRFAVQSGRATFGGGTQTLTVTTNAAGRAVATGLAPTGSGAVQISAAATFQGQTAAVTIAQSNVMTAAEAAAGSASGASGGAGANAGAGAAGGSGGISGTTLGIIGAAVGGGAVAASTVLKTEDEGDDGVSYRGSFSGQATDVLSPNGACAITQAHAGTVSVKIQLSDSGAVNGTGDVSGTMTILSGSAGCPTGTALAPVGATQNHGCCNPSPTVSGTRTSLSFSGNHPGNAGTNWFYDFTGVLNEPDITGTFTLTTTYQNNSPGPSVRVFPVRLSRAAQ
jgi:hypothetical protein